MGFNPEDYTEQNNALSYFNKTIMPVWILPEIEHTFIGYTIESFHGLPLINVNGSKLTTVETIIKRLTDITGSTLALILFSPVMAVIALLIKISSPGPVFYGQERVTLNGKIFTMWKFRSMKVNAEKETGAVWTKKNDDRTTKIGAFIRKTSLDELPQFWNILKGEMSLIGPRPERPVFVEQFKKEIPSYMLRHKMKSGLTGWAQVNGWRGDTSLERRIEFDLYYIQNWSIFLDIKILFLTLINGFVNTNAY
jgi:exopolysaccharide biosynthesis polyprenyl glycosylphosphotransferase